MERGEMMRLMRRVLHAGVSAIRAEEHTVSFETAAWASVQARAGRRPVTLRDLRHFVRRMLRVEGWQSDRCGRCLPGSVGSCCRRLSVEVCIAITKDGLFFTVSFLLVCGRSGVAKILCHA